MKTAIMILSLYALHLSSVFGMGGNPPPPPPFVSAKITSPSHQAPLFLADTNSVTIYMQVSLFTPSSIEGKINLEGTNSVSGTNQNNKNLNWNIPAAGFNTGISLKISESQEIFAALKADSRENGISITGFDFGLSFLITPDKDLHTRLDFGLNFIETDNEAKLLEIESYTKDTIFTSAIGGRGLGPFVSLTMQAAFEDWIVHPYFQASYCHFPLFCIDLYNKEIYSSINTFTLTPGITYRVNNNILLMIGGSYSILSKLEDTSPPGIFLGFVQANFLL